VKSRRVRWAEEIKLIGEKKCIQNVRRKKETTGEMGYRWGVEY